MGIYLWHGFDFWSTNFHMLLVPPKKKKKKVKTVFRKYIAIAGNGENGASGSIPQLCDLQETNLPL